MPLGEDFTRWQVFWEFNKDRFLNLKDAIHAPLAVTGSDEFYMGSSRRVLSLNSLKPSDAAKPPAVLSACTMSMPIWAFSRAISR